MTVHKGEFGKNTEKDDQLSTLTFGHAGSHIMIATDLSLCYDENQPCHTTIMAWLRADGAFVILSTVGAPPQGGACPDVIHATRAFQTPSLDSITHYNISQSLKSDDNIFRIV